MEAEETLRGRAIAEAPPGLGLPVLSLEEWAHGGVRGGIEIPYPVDDR